MKAPTRRSSGNKPVYLRYSFALGALTTLLVSLLLWVISNQLLTGVFGQTVYEAIPAVATLIVAIVSLFMSFSALEEQRRARQASTDPVILVHFGQREDAPSLVTLQISNVGAGAAQNVTVRLDPDVAGALFEQKKVITDFRETMHPIRVIPQDTNVSYNFGMGFRLTEEPFLPPIRVDVSYEDIDGEKYSSLQWLDVKELRWQRADKLPIAKIAAEIESIAKEMTKLTDKNRKQHVLVQSLEDFRAEEEKYWAEIKETLSKQSDRMQEG